ncbi:MAG: hypothetical protein ACYTGX_18630, partial [Planctomycetota bacterium]
NELQAVLTDTRFAKERVQGEDLLRTRFTLATALMLAEKQARRRGEDRRPLLEAALVEHRWLVEQLPERRALWRRLGTDLAALAGLDRVTGRKTLELFNEAVVAYEQALRLAPDDHDSHIGHALVRMDRGSGLASRREDPTADWDAAERSLDACVRAAPDSVSAARLRLNLERRRGQWLRRSGADTQATWAAATAAADRAIDLVPDDPALRADRATLSMHWAHRLRLERQDPAPKFEEAVADYDAALEAVPNESTWLGNRASARLQLSFWHRADPQRAESHLTAALADCDAALKVEANNDIAHSVKIEVLQRLRRHAEALEAAEAAATACPKHAEFPKLRDALRRALGR